MDTNLYWNLRGSYAQRREKLAAMPREWLEASILDSEYNDFLRSRADFKEEPKEMPVDPTIANGRPHGKRLPYIGWFWRHLNFSAGTLPIGQCESFVGFMPNNKWDHPERNTTPEEFAKIMEIIDAAMVANQQGGAVDQIIANTNRELERLWPLLQTFKV